MVMTPTNKVCPAPNCNDSGYAETCGYCTYCWTTLEELEQEDLLRRFGLMPDPKLHPITERVIERNTVERWSLPPKTHWFKRLVAFTFQAIVSGLSAAAALAAYAQWQAR